MSDQNLKQLVLTTAAKINPAVVTEPTALFNPDGTPVSVAPHDAVSWEDIPDIPEFVDAIGEAENGAEARTAIGAAANVLTGYVVDDSDGDGWDGTVAATDTLLEALAKLEARVLILEDLADA